MNYKVKDGIPFLDEQLSKLEKRLFNQFSELLENRGFKYLSIPSIVSIETIIKQDCIPLSKAIKINEHQYLAGSAEQGILEYFSEQKVKPQLIYAKNQCFRGEEEYNDIFRLKEFQKIEQFVFCNKEDWKKYFDYVLENSVEFLKYYNLYYRIIDTTKKDAGYHKLKYDIEVFTKKFGWIETHSCTYFGKEQTKRFNITGATHSISNTGIASPRILIPFIEKYGENIT